MKKLFTFCAFLTMSMSCIVAQAQTVTEIVLRSGGEFDYNYLDYDCLLNAVIAADLAGALAAPDLNATVLAPNDAAFVRLARDLGYNGFNEGEAFNFIVAALTDLAEDDNPIPLLTQILLYHVSPGKKNFFQVIFSSKLETLQGERIRPFFIILRDNEPGVRNPKLFFPLNVKADNGIIQTINRVLLPSNILPD